MRGTRVTRRRGALVALTLAGAALLTACSTVSTGASEVALEYGGGSFDSASFVKCFGGGYKSTVEGASDTYKYYPTGQRDFSFSYDKSADAAPVLSTTRDAQEIKVTGTVKFIMNLSCKKFKDPAGKTWEGGTAQYFHELFGSKDFKGGHAYNEQGSQPYGAGWSDMLKQYLGFALNREVDDNALNYTLQELITDRTKKDGWEKDVLEGLPAVLKKMTGDVEIFRISYVLLDRPNVRPEIADANSQKEAARIRAQATQVDQDTAANFPGGMPAYLDYLNQLAEAEALKEAARQGKVLPVPYGSPMIVEPGR